MPNSPQPSNDDRARTIAQGSTAILMTTLWSKRFYNPIVLADGKKLNTLQDAADFIAALPASERDADDWKLAMEALTLAARRRDYEQLARAVVMKALEPTLSQTPRTID